jgi:hypothetical protein
MMNKMKPIQWIVATAIASVMMLSYVHGFVFPRTEGEGLTRKLDTLDPVLRDINTRLSRIEGSLGIKK